MREVLRMKSMTDAKLKVYDSIITRMANKFYKQRVLKNSNGSNGAPFDNISDLFRYIRDNHGIFPVACSVDLLNDNMMVAFTRFSDKSFRHLIRTSSTDIRNGIEPNTVLIFLWKGIPYVIMDISDFSETQMKMLLSTRLPYTVVPSCEEPDKIYAVLHLDTFFSLLWPNE